jgi:ankyrin repeat protein
MKFLFEHGAVIPDINYALVKVCAQRLYKLVEILLQMGADPNAYFKYENSTPLYATIRSQDKRDMIKTIEILINYGADINDKSYANGNTLLMQLASNYYGVYLDAINFLLKSGANPDVQNNNGETVLMILIKEAQESNNLDFIKAVVDAGANIYIKNNNGETVLDYSTESMAIYLQNQQKKQEKKFKDSWTNLRTMQNVDVNEENKDGDTALILASAQGDLNRVNILLKMGADINHRNRDHQTALHHASVYGHRELVNFLLQHKANSFSKDKNGHRYNDIFGKLKYR